MYAILVVIVCKNFDSYLLPLVVLNRDSIYIKRALHEGTRRNTKEHEGTRRNTKENQN